MKTCLDPLTALPATPDQLIDLALDNDFDHVSFRMYRSVPEEAETDLIDDPSQIRSLRKRVTSTGLKVLGTETVRLDGNRPVIFWDRLLQTSADIGAQTVMVQILDADRTRAIEDFGLLCDRAAALGLRLDLEFIPWTPLAGLADACEMLDSVTSDDVGILVDFLHVARSGSQPEQIAALPPERLRWVQVCDGPAAAPDTREGLIHAGRNQRDLPGAGGLDLAGLYTVLPEDAVYAVEIPNVAAWREEGVAAYVKRVKAALDDSLALAQFRV